MICIHHYVIILEYFHCPNDPLCLVSSSLPPNLWQPLFFFFSLFPCVLCAQSLSHVLLFATPWTMTHQDHLSMEFSRQEYWGGLPFPTPDNLPNPGIEFTSFASPALAGGFFITAQPGQPK